MHLSSIFKEYGVDIEQTKLVRHPLNKEDVREVYKHGMIEAYQSTQSKNCFDNCKYIAAFMGTNKTEALFIGIYEILEVITGSGVKDMMPKGYPYPEHFDKDHVYYRMKKLDVMSEMDQKLVIEWGQGTRSWFQWASNDKEVLSISNRNEIEFPRYEELIISYNQLGDIVAEENRYHKWVDALKNVNGIYLICDTKRNKQYIGSTYNEDGILGRWTEYYKTHHGGDVDIKEHLKKYPDAYYDFQFTILRILPKNVIDKEATGIESVYKNKLCTRNPEYGLNRN